MKGRKGIALITALAVGALLSILAGAFLVLLVNDYQAASLRQQAIQAEWNARAGLEHYLASNELPPRDKETGERQIVVKPGNVCRCLRDSSTGDIRFEGVSGQARRTLVLVGGDPEKVVLEL